MTAPFPDLRLRARLRDTLIPINIASALADAIEPMERSPLHGLVDLAVARYGAERVSAVLLEDPEPEDHVCHRCRDAGRVRLTADPHDPRFGRSFPCGECSPLEEVERPKPNQDGRWDITCANCGRDDSVPFEPRRGGRGLLCRDCFGRKKR